MPEPKPLTKSQYVSAIRCPRWIWLDGEQAELAKPPSAFEEMILQQGQEAGLLARGLYPGGLAIEINAAGSEGAVADTQRALDGGREIIYEATFAAEGLLVRVDILRQAEDRSVELFEVKSSKKAKEEHFPDLAYQKYVVERTGRRVSGVSLILIDGEYARRDALDPVGLFHIASVDEKTEAAYAAIPESLATIEASRGADREPEASIGSICKSPHECKFKSHCWRDVPEDSVETLYRLSPETRNRLRLAEIERIRDIPTGFELTEKQHAQIRSEQSGQVIVDTEQVRKHLTELEAPIYFLDFECLANALPRYPGARPHQALPFQYSLHIRDEEIFAPVREEAIQHREYLHDHDSDPREPLLKRLLDDVGSEGSIVVYSKQYEDARLKELARDFPDHADAIGEIRARLWDLEVPFSRKWFVHPEFHGRSSIKVVLPALVPTASYEELTIQNGTMAMQQYLEMIDGHAEAALTSDTSPSDDMAPRAAIRRELLEYCKLDTWAMVEILGVLEAAVPEVQGQ